MKKNVRIESLQNKLGFTLIELLAVMVILAIIAIIAVPIVLNIISDTKKSAEVRSSEFYVKALNNSIGNKYIENRAFKLEDGKYDVMSDGSVCIGIVENEECTGDKIKVKINGELPSGGYIDIVDKKIIFYDLKMNNKYVSKIEHTPEECFEMSENEITRFICAPKVWDKETSTSIENTNKINNIIDIVIPSEINGVKVISIGKNAFNGNQILSVQMPNSITTIKNSAFQDNQLTNVVLPNNLKELYNQAFYNNQLKSIIIPSSVTEIRYYVFKYNQITNLIIPDSITTLGVGAFQKNKLRSVQIPDSIVRIEVSTFAENQLESVIIPNSVTSIGTNAFYDNKITSIEIPESVTTIEQRAFYSNNLTNIIIPSNVTSIGTDAFINNQLTRVTIKGKSSTTDFASYPSSRSPFGWVSGYSDANIIWQP